MLRFIVRRVVRGLVALFLFQSLLFGLVHALPYDFSAFVLAPPDRRAFIQHELGLDRPLREQYVRWLSGFARLDLGTSYLFWPTPVSEVLFSRLARTLLLFLSAAVLAYLLGIWLGKVIAWRRGGLAEVGVTLGGVAAYTSFAPWLGFVMINVFGWYLDWLPYQRLINPNIWFNVPVAADVLLAALLVTVGLAFGGLLLVRQALRCVRARRWRWGAQAGVLLAMGSGAWWWWSRSGLGYLALDVLAHLALPLTTVVLLSFGETMMLMRTAMLETLGEDYVLMARAKGLPDKIIRDRHVARNAILPVITRLALNLPFVLVGSLVIERVFMWHAMGQVVFLAVEFQDIPVLLGVLSVVGVLTLIAHAVLDVVYIYLDPRMRYAGGG
ncbi:MAG TPA: ABC transporter permease [Anaerolineales bacterium]|nr:ABC transporter permease [Anaerolineales bacterium]